MGSDYWSSAFADTPLKGQNDYLKSIANELMTSELFKDVFLIQMEYLGEAFGFNAFQLITKRLSMKRADFKTPLLKKLIESVNFKSDKSKDILIELVADENFLLALVLSEYCNKSFYLLSEDGCCCSGFFSFKNGLIEDGEIYGIGGSDLYLKFSEGELIEEKSIELSENFNYEDCLTNCSKFFYDQTVDPFDLNGLFNIDDDDNVKVIQTKLLNDGKLTTN